MKFLFFIFFLIQEANAYQVLADEIHYSKNLITASGNVKVMFDNYLIESNELLYNNNLVESTGEVKVRDKSGALIATGNNLIFNQKTSQGIIKNIEASYSKHNLIADKVFYIGKLLTINNARFSTCRLCKNERSIWEISSKNTHISPGKTEDSQEIVYRNAFFKVYGIPIIYLPYFKQTVSKDGVSGFLNPQYSNNSITIPIYFRIKTYSDMTITPTIFKNYFILDLEQRHLFEKYGIHKLDLKIMPRQYNAKAKLGSRYEHYYLKSGIKSKFGTKNLGYNIERTSSTAFVRNNSYTSEPFLVSKIFLENIGESSVYKISTFYFQDLNASGEHIAVFPYLHLKTFYQNNNLEFNTNNYFFNINSKTRSISDLEMRQVFNTSFGSDLFFESMMHNYYDKSLGTSLNLGIGWKHPFLAKYAKDKYAILSPKIYFTSPLYDLTKQENNFEKSMYNIFNMENYDVIKESKRSKKLVYGIESNNVYNDKNIKIFVGATNKSYIINNFSISGQNSAFSNTSYLDKKHLFSNLNESILSIFGNNFSLNLGYYQYAQNLITRKINKNFLQSLFINLNYKHNDFMFFGDFKSKFPLQNKNIFQQTIGVTYYGECVNITTKFLRNKTKDTIRNIYKQKSTRISISLNGINF